MLGDDLGRLRDRVLKLQKHFGDANEDVRQILISADKIEKRAGRIEELDFSKTDAPEEVAPVVDRRRRSCFPHAAQARRRASRPRFCQATARHRSKPGMRGSRDVRRHMRRPEFCNTAHDRIRSTRLADATRPCASWRDGLRRATCSRAC